MLKSMGILGNTCGEFLVRQKDMLRMSDGASKKGKLPKRWLRPQWVVAFSSNDRESNDEPVTYNTDVIHKGHFFSWLITHQYSDLTEVKYRTALKRLIIDKGPGYSSDERNLIPDELRKLLADTIKELGASQWGFKRYFFNRRFLRSVCPADELARAERISRTLLDCGPHVEEQHTQDSTGRNDLFQQRSHETTENQQSHHMRYKRPLSTNLDPLTGTLKSQNTSDDSILYSNASNYMAPLLPSNWTTDFIQPGSSAYPQFSYSNFWQGLSGAGHYDGIGDNRTFELRADAYKYHLDLHAPAASSSRDQVPLNPNPAFFQERPRSENSRDDDVESSREVKKKPKTI